MIIENADVLKTISNYPKEFAHKILFLRDLLFEVIKENNIDDCEETLKWGEPSYISKSGSTIRFAWNKSKPEFYGIYFNCQTKLISTFKVLFGDKFRFEGNRAILFELNDEIPVDETKICLYAALTYHKRKNKINLGL